MTPTLPPVGSRIRWTLRNARTRDAKIVEGVVEEIFDSEPFANVGRVPHARMRDGDTLTLREPLGYVLKVEVLAESYPPEPHCGVSGQVVTNNTEVWARGFGGWFDVFRLDSDPIECLPWPELWERHPGMVPMLSTPAYHALVRELRAAAQYRHEEMHLGDLDQTGFETCAEQDCADVVKLIGGA